MTVQSILGAEDVALGDHVCVPYDSRAQAMAYTADFAAAGLSRGHRVLVFTHELAPGAMRAHLASRIPGIAEAVARGQLAVVSTWDVHLLRGVFDPDRTRDGLATAVDESRRDGHSGLWVSVDMTWAAEGLPGVEHLVDYEGGAGGLFSRRWLALACQYDRRRFDAALLARACAAHTGSPGNALLRFALTDAPTGGVFSGQVDATNGVGFAAMLAQLPADGALLDLTRVTFMDVAAVGAVARVAADRVGGALTVLCRPALARLLRLHGVDTVATVHTAG